MPAPFASPAALHSRLLSYHPDACFLFLCLSPTISLFIFPLQSQITGQPARYRQTKNQAWLHFGKISKDFFPFFTFPSNYTSTCVAVRILFNLAQEYWSTAYSLVILKFPDSNLLKILKQKNFQDY
jgi:hypothetical protein